jgi:hypothetical protein
VRVRVRFREVRRGTDLLPSESDGDLGVVLRVDHRHALPHIPFPILAIFLESIVSTLREQAEKRRR